MKKRKGQLSPSKTQDLEELGVEWSLKRTAKASTPNEFHRDEDDEEDESGSANDEDDEEDIDTPNGNNDNNSNSGGENLNGAFNNISNTFNTNSNPSGNTRPNTASPPPLSNSTQMLNFLENSLVSIVKKDKQ